MKVKFEIKVILSATPAEVYSAWLNSELHSAMTGGSATCSNEVNGEFTAWDGYISGKNLELNENERIVQSWRTSEFQEHDEDSLLSITLKAVEGGTELIIGHFNIPAGETQYEQGWQDHYFTPMKAYFND